jgi:hypothetical protein
MQALSTPCQHRVNALANGFVLALLTLRRPNLAQLVASEDMGRVHPFSQPSPLHSRPSTVSSRSFLVCLV